MEMQETDNLLNEFFGGERSFGTGKDLPQINNVLTTGEGLINNDDQGETGRMFGI